VIDEVQRKRLKRERKIKEKELEILKSELQELFKELNTVINKGVIGSTVGLRIQNKRTEVTDLVKTMRK